MTTVARRLSPALALACVVMAVAIGAIAMGWWPPAWFARWGPLMAVVLLACTALVAVAPRLGARRRIAMALTALMLGMTAGSASALVGLMMSESGPAMAALADSPDTAFTSRGSRFDLWTGEVAWRYDNQHQQPRVVVRSATELLHGWAARVLSRG